MPELSGLDGLPLWAERASAPGRAARADSLFAVYQRAGEGVES